MLPYYRLYRGYLKQAIALSLPIMIGQLGTVLMGVADTVMVGKVGEISLAASGVANAVFFLVVLLGIGTLTAVSPLVSIASSSAAKIHKSFRYYRNSLIVAVLLSVFINIVIQVCAVNFEWFGQDPAVTKEVKPYLTVINISVLPMLLFLAAKQLSDGLGNTIPATVITFAALGLNVFLNWLLIYGIWIFPKWGLFGAGVATLISRIFMALAMLLYVRYAAFFRSFRDRINRKQWYEPLYLRQILAKGLPSGFQFFFEVGAFATAAIMIGQISSSALAAHQVAINPASVTYMIATGLAAGGGILVGDAYGRRNRRDIIKAGSATLILSLLFMSCCAAGMILLQGPILNAYIAPGDKEVYQIASGLLTIAALFQLSDGVQAVGLGLLRGLKDVNIPTFIALFAYWVVGIPVGYQLAFKYSMGASGIWLGLLAGLTVSAILLTYRFYSKAKTLYRSAD